MDYGAIATLAVFVGGLLINIGINKNAATSAQQASTAMREEMRDNMSALRDDIRVIQNHLLSRKG